jgi:hypothetical protein
VSSLGDAESLLGVVKSSLGDTLRARWVTLRARWVTLRARWLPTHACSMLPSASLSDGVSLSSCCEPPAVELLSAHQLHQHLEWFNDSAPELSTGAALAAGRLKQRIARW